MDEEQSQRHSHLSFLLWERHRDFLSRFHFGARLFFLASSTCSFFKTSSCAVLFSGFPLQAARSAIKITALEFWMLNKDFILLYIVELLLLIFILS